jgi:hypothetical protein
LYHRALKAAIPPALCNLYGLPFYKALDLIETQAIGKLRSLLEQQGWTYHHELRCWQAAYEANGTIVPSDSN